MPDHEPTEATLDDLAAVIIEYPEDRKTMTEEKYELVDRCTECDTRLMLTPVPPQLDRGDRVEVTRGPFAGETERVPLCGTGIALQARSIPVLKRGDIVDVVDGPYEGRRLEVVAVLRRKDLVVVKLWRDDRPTSTIHRVFTRRCRLC